MNNYTLLQSIYLKELDALTHLLTKAEAHVKEKGIEDSALLNASIYPDMFNFTKQIQISTDNIRRNMRLLASKEHVAIEDNETTLAQLKERVAKTKEVIAPLTESDFAGADDVHMTFQWMPGGYVLGKDLIQEHAIQNTMFHVVTAYNILRKEGVVIGKSDFITALTVNH